MNAQISRLTTLRRAKQPALPVSIVLIPGIGTLNANEWDLDWLPERATIYAFDYTPTIAAKGVNRIRIESESGRLLKALQALQSPKGKSKTSLLLITHSLGSLILAQALSAAQTQVRLDNLSLVGVVFFSCVQVSPALHGASSSASAESDATVDTKTAEVARIVAISEAYARVPLTERGVNLLHPWLAKTSAQFRYLIKNTPVASVYETLTTQFYNERSQLVTINPPAPEPTTKRQMPLAVEADHNALCNVEYGSLLYDNLRDWLQKIVPRSFERTGSLGPLEVPKQLPTANPASFSTDGLGSLISPVTQPVSTNLNTLPEAAPGPFLPIFFVPFSRNHNFYGRGSELRSLARCLCSSSIDSIAEPSLKSFVLSGNGGLGKSQLSLEFVYQNTMPFDAILWITAESQEKTDESFADIATQLGLVNQYSAKARDKLYTRRLVLEWLENPVKSYSAETTGLARWLLVFDNVYEPSMLTTVWPRTNQGSILITTRYRALISGFRVTEEINLEPFQTEDSKALLYKYTRQSRTKADQGPVEELVKMLAGLPLAITQMASVMEERTIGFIDFLELYRDETKRSQFVKAERSGLHAIEYEHNLATVWSFDKLSKDGKLLIDILSFLDPDGIPEFILTSLGTIPTDLAGLVNSGYDYEEARSELLKMSLIQRDQKQRNLIVHRMVQDSARATMDDEDYCATLMSALQLMDAAWTRDDEPANDPVLWKKYSLLYKHCVLLGRLAASNRFHPPKTATIARLQAIDVLLEAVWYGTMRSHFEDTNKLLELAGGMLDIFRQNYQNLNDTVQEQLHDIESRFEHKSGVLALHVNEKRASLYHLHRHVVMLEEVVLREKREQQVRWGWALNELGNAYLQNGEAGHAEEQFQRAVDFFDSMDDTSTSMLTMPLINLGFALWLQGRLEEAMETLELARSMREVSYGKDDTISFSLGKLYLGLGNVLAQQNDMDGSLRWHELCVQQYTETLGPFHHRTADGSVKLADHHFRIGEYRLAQKRLDDAAMIYGNKDIFKPERARVAYIRWKLASAVNDDDADSHADEALKLYKAVNGNAPVSFADLTDQHFDENIIFWSR